MNIHLSQYAGFCDGVKRAYEMVNSLEMAKLKMPIYILGSLVHNQDVNKKIIAKGVKPISREDFFNSKIGEIGTLILTAHGVGPRIYAWAKKNQFDLIDATCPKVMKAQRLAQVFSNRQQTIVLVGDKGHKEVEGIRGWGGQKVVIISNEEDLKNSNFKLDEKLTVLAQTTQDEKFFNQVVEFLRQKYSQVTALETICYSTQERQLEIKKLAQQNDLVVIIGSKTSANSNRLFEIAQDINSKAYFIENAQAIKKEWFSGVKNVAITAGASTPEWVIKKVLEKIKQL